jgi:hypothetical protein
MTKIERMEDPVRFSTRLTKAEVRRCAWFFILWNAKQWLFIFATAYGAGFIVEDWIRNISLAAVLWILLWVAFILVAGYFRIVRKWLAADYLFEQMEYCIDGDAITVRVRGSDRLLSLATVRRVAELREFFVIYGPKPVFFLPKKAASDSQVEIIRAMLRRYTRERSDRFTRWIGHVIFKL